MRSTGPCSIIYNPAFSEKWLAFLSPLSWRGAVKAEYRDVPVESLEHAGSLTDPDVVEGWKSSICAGRPIPPAIVSETKQGSYYVHDGNHRLSAMRECLGQDGMVRVLVVRPLPGFLFIKTRFDGYETYLLERSPMRAYVIPTSAAAAASAIAVTLAARAPNGAQEPSFAVAVAIVVICARFAGWIAGLLASALTACLTAYFLLPPTGSLVIGDPIHTRELSIALIAMLLLSVVVGYRRNDLADTRT